MGNYSEKLKDPRWQKKRLEILERDGWKCMACGETEKTLHVHHIFYFPKKEPWDIPNGFLITFCEQCHDPQASRCSGANSCEECGSYGGDGGCIGLGKPSEEILDGISVLLNNIWESDGNGDVNSLLGWISFNLPRC